ncbi:MAG: 23S rRNA (adenine(1618)-N(6))-methyltransferase RlmF [Pedobacter sp.]|nr:MAG: 23S rRNA (adenine(1618)-N(6))-methyltransferase RlmF [Pedobacter sp.]
MSEAKNNLHPRNRHQFRYDFKELVNALPELASFVRPNPYGDESIDFSDPKAVKTLNKALLKHFYGIAHWDIPEGYLCPPIPGRADYIHYAADLLTEDNGKIPTGSKISVLDIGIGANCVYPIIGNSEYGWSFVGSDIDQVAIRSARNIVNINPSLKGEIEIRHQLAKNKIFSGVIRKYERFDLTICNPPFHSSQAEALEGTKRKVRNLSGKNLSKPTLNFGGKANELWTPGGELAFISNMIEESKTFAKQCMWFTSLVSKSENLGFINARLKAADAQEIKTIPMTTGNKVSRMIAWSFLTEQEKHQWTAKWD